MVSARAYEPDKQIVDVEDPPPRRSRVRTEDLIMHVRLDDGWHRMSPDGLETACGAPIDMRLQIQTRPGRFLEHPLAPPVEQGGRCECWTKRERDKASITFLAKWGHDYKP
jgi:hypothetical protein